MLAICPNLKDKKVAAEFNELLQALDNNKDAAYLIWSMNNGNSIDLAPNGEPSILFADLLTKYNGNRVSAIRDKAISFADNFIKNSEDANGEVLLKDLYDGISKNPASFETKPEERSTTKNLLSLSLDQKSYTQSKINSLLSSSSSATNADVVDTMLESKKEWANLQQERIVGETLQKLIEAFGLVETESGYEIPGDNSETAKLRILFVKNMSTRGYIDSYKKAAIDHYIISIGLAQGDATTFNHELAHYYIRTFSNSKLVQSALDLYAKKGMSIDEIEEALADAITERSVNNEFGDNLENQSFFHKFWYGFNNLLYKVFNIKTDTAKKAIADLLTKSFLVNDTLELTENDAKYKPVFHRMYQSEYLQRKEKKSSQQYKKRDDKYDVTAGNIINASRSRQKSYDQRMRSDKIGIFASEEQAVRNAENARIGQEAKQKIELARKDKNIEAENHEKAQLYLSFLKNAYTEAQQLRVMMLNAEANKYRRLMYKPNEDGSRSYTRVEDDQYISERNPTEGMLSTEYTFDDLEYAKTDILGFFKPIVTSIKTIIQSAEADGFSKEDIQLLRDMFELTDLEIILEDIERTYNDGLREKVRILIDDIVLSRTDLDNDMKARLRVNMYKWLNDQMDYGDVKAAEVWVGLGSRSKSPILRAVQDMLADMLDERDKQVYDKGIHLMDLKRKAEKHMGFKYKFFYNVLKLLVLMDKNGMPTGNWLSEYNDGQYYQDRDAFRDELLFGNKFKGKYNQSSIEQQIKNITLEDGSKLIKDPSWKLEIDETGAPILPDHPDADEIYKNYLREYDTWLSEHIERPYTLRYYLDRINTLSVPTLKAVNAVNAKISAITGTVTREGKPRFELLTQSQVQMLTSYEKERRDLGNFYDADDRLKNQNSVEYLIAYDLMMWNRKVSDKIKYITDTDQYEQSKNSAKNPRMFERMFSHMSINPRLWEIIKRSNFENPDRNLDPEQKRLSGLLYQRSLFLSRYQGDRIAEIKWDKLFDESSGRLKLINFWKNLNLLDTEITRLQSKLSEKYKTIVSPYGMPFGTVMDKFLIPYEHLSKADINWADPNTETRYYHMVQRMKQAMDEETDPNKKNEILSEILLLRFYQIGRDEDAPLSIFSTYIPKLAETIYDEHDGTGEEKIKDFVRTPISLFAKIDRINSDKTYVNENYIENSDDIVQLKEMYKDSRWDVINDPKNKPLKDLYDELKSSMEEAWKMIPYMSKYDNRLSLIAGRTGLILGRNMFHKYGLQFGKNFGEWFRREISVVETDTDFRANDDKEQRPDGSDIENIPIRFVKRLPKSLYINLDVVGSTIAFYDMALNYKIKAQHAAELTAILNRLEQNSLSGSYKHAFDAQQSEVLDGMLQRLLYDKHSTGGGNIGTGAEDYISENKWRKGTDWIRKYVIGTSRDWLKRIGKTRIIFQSGMLALNLTSGIISFLDPFMSLLIDTITGKYINAKDVAYAVGLMVIGLPAAIGSLGRISPIGKYNKPMAAMQRFLLAKGNLQTFKDTDLSLVMRFLTDGLTMKYFSVGDYTINTINMIATMNNYRYYKDSTGEAKFYAKPQFIQKVMLDKNCSVYEARTYYKNAQTLWNSHTTDENGKFVTTNDEYGKAVDAKTEASIRKQIRSRSSIYNGIVPDIERTYLQTNVFWSFITLLRNFLITGVWERFLTYRDFLVSTFDEEGNPEVREATSEERKLARKNQNYYKGGYSFATRQIENAVNWSGLYGFAHTYSYLKYAYFLAKNSRKEGGSLSKYDPQNQLYMKEHNLNQQDVYGMQKMAMECFGWMFLLMAYSATQRTADDDPDDYKKLLANLIVLRLAIERYTWYSPTTAMELIQSPTTALADWKRKMLLLGLGADLVGLTGKDLNEPIKRGYYQTEARWKYDLFNIMSHWGLNNWYKTMPEIIVGGVNIGGGGARALKNTTNFYRTLRPEPAKWLEDEDNESSSGSSLGSSPFSSSFGSSNFGSSFESSF